MKWLGQAAGNPKSRLKGGCGRIARPGGPKRRAISYRLGAPIEEQLPLRPLDLQRLSLLLGPRTLSRRFAVVDEGHRIPEIAEFDADFRGTRAQGRKDRMLADLPEPVPGVPRVGFLPVHDGMPVTPLLGLEILRHAVRVIPAGKVKVQSRQHRRRQFRRLEQIARLRRTTRTARQRHQPLAVSIQRQNACDFVTIRVWIEHRPYSSIRNVIFEPSAPPV